MLLVTNVTKQFRGADAPILKNISFIVNSGERIGLVGPNGSGKTTLLNLIMGRLAPDEGSIQLNPPALRIGYLAQGPEENDAATIQDVLYPQLATLHAAESEVEKLADVLAEATENEFDAVLAAYGEALERLESLNQSVETGRGEAILAGL